MTQRIAMTMHLHSASVCVRVWHGSTLYIFAGAIRQAKGRARCYPLIHDLDVADFPSAGLSLVWMDGIPYLFPGSLSKASHRGKTWKGEHRKNVAIALYHRRLEAAGFEGQYGSGIGENSGGK